MTKTPPAQKNRTSNQSGIEFERELHDLVANILPSSGAVFDSLIIEDKRGTTQIDLIVILPTAFIVVEAKQMAGLIVGGQYDKRWMQCLASGKSRFFFQNPFRQNYRHMKALETLTDIPIDTMVSAVVFGGRCKLGDNIPPLVFKDKESFILYLQQLPPSPILFTKEQIEFFCGKIAFAKQAGSLAQERHIQSLSD
ncbi:NERD domain-containing protein [Photobacterium damselae]